MTASRDDRLPQTASGKPASAASSLTRSSVRNERARPTRRDNPDAARARRRRPPERQPRTYTMPEFAPRRKQAHADEPPSPEQLDRWDEEWREEWDRGDVDDSAAYEDDTLDVAEQTRDVEWLLDALDALDDGDGDDTAFEWDDES
jgi:hypothetical protein